MSAGSSQRVWAEHNQKFWCTLSWGKKNTGWRIACWPRQSRMWWARVSTDAVYAPVHADFEIIIWSFLIHCSTTRTNAQKAYIPQFRVIRNSCPTDNEIITLEDRHIRTKSTNLRYNGRIHTARCCKGRPRIDSYLRRSLSIATTTNHVHHI